MTNFQWTSWASFGALAAVAVTAWRQALGVLNRLVDLCFARVTVSGDAHLAVLSYMWDKNRVSPFRKRVFGADVTYVNRQNRCEAVGYETLGSQASLMWVGRWPVVICRPAFSAGSQAPLNTGESAGVDRQLNLWFIRGTVDPDQFVLAALKNYNALHHGAVNFIDKNRKRFTVIRVNATGSKVEGSDRDDSNSKSSPGPAATHTSFEDRVRTKSIRLLGYDIMDIGVRSSGGDPFAWYAFPAGVTEHLPEIQSWLESEKWYRDKGIPWRRGWLLEGPTGTGKSTLVRCMGMKYDLPVYVFDIGAMDNEIFVIKWSLAQYTAPCIILIEDFDAVFKGRENIARASQKRDVLTFDCFLNTISGVGNSDGIFLIVTTNHPETLDSALGQMENNQASRPGRIDRIIHLGPMEPTERYAVARHILSDFPQLIEETVNGGAGKTAAQFQNECAQLALTHYWQKKLEQHNTKSTLLGGTKDL